MSETKPLGGGREGGGRRQPQVEFVLPLLASPVEAAGCKRVVGTQVAAPVSQTEAVALWAHAHLHGDGTLERQASQPRRQAGERRERAGRNRGRKQTGLVGLQIFPRAHRSQGLAVGQHVQLG